jgi:hypothetical protein
MLKLCGRNRLSVLIIEADVKLTYTFITPLFQALMLHVSPLKTNLAGVFLSVFFELHCIIL